MNEKILDIFKSVILLSGMVTITPTDEFADVQQLGANKEFITRTLLSLAGEEISIVDEINAAQLKSVTQAGLSLGNYVLTLLNTLEDAGIEVDEDGHRVLIPDTREESDLPF